jgi:inorganic triphosphatase YgiF
MIAGPWIHRELGIAKGKTARIGIMMEREIEVKLLAPSVELMTAIERRDRLAGVPLTSAGGRLQEDTYLDTPGFDLLRAGFSLRHRRREGVAKATLKSIPGRNDRALLRDREEIEEPIGADRAPMAAGGRIEEVVREILGDAKPGPVVRIRTQRRMYRLGDGAVLCIDRAQVFPGKGGKPVDGFLEVEVEDTGGGRELLERAGHELMDEHGLGPSALSKFERGLRVLGLLERARGEGGTP